MADYVELGDVRTWYDEHGQGEPVLLLHPGRGPPGLGAEHRRAGRALSTSSRWSGAATGAHRTWKARSRMS